MERQIRKLLYIVTSGEFGGVQTHILQLSSALKDNYEIAVAMGAKGMLWPKLEAIGVRLYHIPSLVRPISLYRDYTALYELVKVIRTFQPDLISLHSSKAGILGRIAAKICDVPAVFTAHGWAFTEGVPILRRALYVFLEALAAPLAKRIICVSEHDRRLALRFCIGREKRLVTVHNGMPCWRPRAGRNQVNGKVAKVVMVARFSEQKDHALLLRAIRRLSRENFRLLLVGDGPNFQKARQLSRLLNIADQVDFLGARDDVPELLADADIFVLASHWEGFPRSILEAMRAVLPVIASDVGGVREAVIDGETGYLVPSGDEEALALRLGWLIDQPALRKRMGERGSSRFNELFSFEAMLNRTLEVYRDVACDVVARVQEAPSVPIAGIEAGNTSALTKEE